MNNERMALTARPAGRPAAREPGRFVNVQEGEGPRWLWFGGVADNVDDVRSLASALCPSRAVTWFSDHNRDDELAAVVDDAVAAIVALGVKAPCIIGYGDGCVLAWAVVAALAGLDRPVELLALVDPPTLPPDPVAATFVFRPADAGLATSRRRWDLGCGAPEPIGIPLCVLSHESAGLAPEEAARWLRRVPDGRFFTFHAGTTPRWFECVTEQVSQALPQRAYSPLVTLQSGRTGGELYVCIPGAGDNVVAFFDLVGELGADARVIGLQPRGLNPHDVPHSTIAAAVDGYLAALGELPAGAPIHLVGHSFGGWVALALASRLSAAHATRTLASLTIIDSEPPSSRLTVRDRSDVLRRWIEILEMGAGTSLEIDVERMQGQTLHQRIAAVHRALVAAGVLPARTPADALHGAFRMFRACLGATDAPLHSYDGKVRLVYFDDPRQCADSNTRRFETWRAEWSRQLGNVEAIRGSGNHVTGLKLPHVRGLVRDLGFRGR